MIAELIDKAGEARLTDLARGLGVTHVTANRTIKRLQRQGLVTTQPYRSIFLTADGRRLAKESRDRHESVVRFLMALGVPSAVAESDAEGIEHHVSRETLAGVRPAPSKAPVNSASVTQPLPRTNPDVSDAFQIRQF